MCVSTYRKTARHSDVKNSRIPKSQPVTSFDLSKALPILPVLPSTASGKSSILKYQDIVRPLVRRIYCYGARRRLHGVLHDLLALLVADCLAE